MEKLLKIILDFLYKTIYTVCIKLCEYEYEQR